MDRRDFLKIGGLGLAGLALPFGARAVAAEQLLGTIDLSLKKSIADAALEAATRAGASYCDVRIGRYLRQFVITREDKVAERRQHRVDRRRRARDRERHLGLRRHQRPDRRRRRRRGARRRWRSPRRIRASRPSPCSWRQAKGVGEVSWTHADPQERDGRCRSRKRSTCCSRSTPRRMKAGASFINSILFLVNEQKYFASTDGSYIDQDIHRIWAPFTVTAVDKASGKFRTRDGLSAPMGMGWEYLERRPGRAASRLPNGVIDYGTSYDMVEDATAAAQQAREKLTAPSVKPGKYDLVLDPSHLWLTIHESVGHPLELDRVLGYEANYAGTSFATLDKWKSKTSSYGSDKVDALRRQDPAEQPRRRRLRRRGRQDQALGPRSRTASWSTTRRSATRPTSSARRTRTAAATPTPGPACSSSACRTSRSRRARRS